MSNFPASRPKRRRARCRLDVVDDSDELRTRHAVLLDANLRGQAHVGLQQCELCGRSGLWIRPVGGDECARS